MNGNSLGKRFVVTSYGESHGPEIGVIIDGCPAGLQLDSAEIERELQRRRPSGQSHSTSRKEADRLDIRSGVFNGHTTGAPISLSIRNIDTRSEQYEQRKYTPRPGQADLVARLKYGGFEDYRGGGRFSARITAGFVAAGAVAKQLVETIGITVYAHTVEIGGIRASRVSFENEQKASRSDELGCADAAASRQMLAEISHAKERGDTIGGIIEAVAAGTPPGLGEPVFDTLEGDLSKAFYAIPSVKAVEFGAGFESARMRGSEYNDPLLSSNGQVRVGSNNAGGIVGGISNGQRIVCRLAFRPPSSIAIPQETVDLRAMQAKTLAVKGRFDTCVVPRAIPIVEAMMAVVLADHSLWAGLIPPVLRAASSGRPAG